MTSSSSDQPPEQIHSEHLATLTVEETEALKWAASRELELHGGRVGFEALQSGWTKLCKALGFDPTGD